jgi:OHCU decarboxylase
MKRLDTGDFFQAWGGIASLQFGLPAVWTEARRRGHSIERVVAWMSAQPARMAGLFGRKGVIAEGADADLVCFQPDESIDWTHPIYHRHSLTPYEGRAFTGVVERTIVRGETVYKHRQFAAPPSGTVIYGPLHALNMASASDAHASLLRCCGSTRWAAQMTAERPYTTVNHLLARADAVWSEASVEDWLEAFRAHPRIGDRSGSKWSQAEQAGTRAADEETTRALAEGNDEYYDRFGFIFIICASGLSAAAMLAALRRRLGNDRETELRIAAGEQRRITGLRLLTLAAP